MKDPLVTVHEDGGGRRTYEVEGVRYPSVTTILQETFPRPHLSGWASSLTAKAAIEGRHEGMSPKEAYTYLQRTPFRYMRSRGDVGSAVHDQLERILEPVIEGGKAIWWKDPAVAGYLDAARAFCRDYLSGVLSLETRVFSDAHRYAGAADLWGVSKKGGRQVVLVDWKTGKGLHPDHALQLAAYAGADWMVDGNGKKRAVPAAGAAAVVRLADDGAYEARWLRGDTLTAYKERFVQLVELKRFLDEGNGIWDGIREGGAAG